MKNLYPKIHNLLLMAIIAVLGYAVLSGCDEHRHHYTKKTTQTVHVYKVHQTNSPVQLNVPDLSGSTDTATDNDQWIFWYVMMYNNNYYYYSSPTYYASPSSYSSFTWSKSSANPVAEEEVIEVSTATVPNEELGQAMNDTIEDNETTEAQEDAMVNEGNPNTGETSESSESDSSSGDSGSGSSGGDSGGGDGGGGGE